jgi:hypothetical protein
MCDFHFNKLYGRIHTLTTITQTIEWQALGVMKQLASRTLIFASAVLYIDGLDIHETQREKDMPVYYI